MVVGPTGHNGQADAYYRKALSLRPNDSNILGWYSVLKWSAEEFDYAIRLGEKAHSLDPASAWVGAFIGNTLHAAGEFLESIALHEKTARKNPATSMPYLLQAIPQHAIGEDDRAGALEAFRKALEEPQYRQEILLRTFLKQDNWHDPMLEEPEFLELRNRLVMT